MKNIYLFFSINIIFLLIPYISFSQDIPEWVINPHMDGYRYCASGYADENSNLSLQKKIARINALSELSKTINVNVENQLDIKKESESRNGKVTGSKKEISSTSRQFSNTSINDAKEIENYVNNKSGKYYILLCIK